MEVKAKGKYIQISPRKAKEVSSLIKGKNALEALDMLRLVPKKATLPISKVLKSAVANAENNFSARKEELYISEIIINGGPVLKRYQSRAQGRVYPIRRRTSHIEIILSGTDLKKAQKAQMKLSKKKEEIVKKSEEKIIKKDFKDKEKDIEKIKKTPKNIDTKEKGISKIFRRKSV